MKKTIKVLAVVLCVVLMSSCGGGNCGNYSDWKYDRKECDNNFWCIFKSQKATYIYYVRQKECQNGIVQQTKKEKVKCGC